MLKKSRKQSKKRYSFLVLAIATLALFLGLTGSVRANVLGSKDAVVTALASYLNSNPTSDLAEQVASKLLASLDAEEEALGGTFNRGTFVAETTSFSALGLRAGTQVGVAEKCESTTFPNSSSTAYTFLNNTQDPVLLTFSDLWITDAPSATIAITAGTSAISATAYDELGRLGTESLVDGLYNRLILPTSTFGGTRFLNTRLVTSTHQQGAAGNGLNAGENLASSTAFARCGGEGGSRLLECRVGTHPDSSIPILSGEYLLVHLESSDKQWAVTTTPSTSTPSTAPQDVRRRTEGDVGLRGRFTACYTSVTSSTLQ